MNVQQVIEALQKFPVDMEVMVWGGSDCDYEVEVNTVKEGSEWQGPDTPARKFVLID